MTFDYVIIGSGFGGSVAALRLAEKGYRVAVIEKGRRWRAQDYASTNWQVWKWLWAPRLFCTGIQQLTFLKNVLVLSGCGVGGGSLVYCAVLLKPPLPFFEDPQWSHLKSDWEKTLEPFYNTARSMLGVTPNPKLWESDDHLYHYAREINREQHFKPTEVGIYFGDPDQEHPDPYFNGIGPPRRGCDHSGHCMVGCKQGGKNSLDRNYLFLAERLGVKIYPQTEAITIIHDNGAYQIITRKSTGVNRSQTATFISKGVVLAAGALGTTTLLLRCKHKGTLPNLSSQVGKNVRTNSEVLVGAISKNKKSDYSKGISITSSLFVNDHTHIEPVRYPRGSDIMFWLSTLMTDGSSRWKRPLTFLWNCLTHPLLVLRTLNPVGWARRSIILLVMQNHDNRLELSLRRKWLWPFIKSLTSTWSTSTIPSYIPEANHAAKSIAKKINGFPSNSVTEVVLNMPLSAHILGGCVMGKDADHGVVDAHCRVFNYENMHIVDGSIIPANLGVNPSLTITALAEYAMNSIPNAKEKV